MCLYADPLMDGHQSKVVQVLDHLQNLLMFDLPLQSYRWRAVWGHRCQGVLQRSRCQVSVKLCCVDMSWLALDVWCQTQYLAAKRPNRRTVELNQCKSIKLRPVSYCKCGARPLLFGQVSSLVLSFFCLLWTKSSFYISCSTFVLCLWTFPVSPALLFIKNKNKKSTQTKNLILMEHLQLYSDFYHLRLLIVFCGGFFTDRLGRMCPVYIALC